MAQLLGNVVLHGKIHTLTGLHVGGSSENLQIGGVDGWVIRDPNTKYPYIPGSSIKGKMRMLSEYAQGLVTNGDVVSDPDTPVAQIFGTSAEEAKIGPTRILVRDAYPDSETVEMWEQVDSDLQYTELKGENTINRITSKANPRFFERVVKGSRFDFEMVYSIYSDLKNSKGQVIDDINNFKHVFQALTLLEHSALGGHGSRGYGRIEFELEDIQTFSIADYESGQGVFKSTGKFKKLSEFEIEEQLKKIKTRLS